MQPSETIETNFACKPEIGVTSATKKLSNYILTHINKFSKIIYFFYMSAQDKKRDSNKKQ